MQAADHIMTHRATKLNQGLEHLCCKDRLGELGVFRNLSEVLGGGLDLVFSIDPNAVSGPCPRVPGGLATQPTGEERGSAQSCCRISHSWEAS